jgi:predicted O-linked N-acetylglucosamine transferase (SPINDLY family)
MPKSTNTSQHRPKVRNIDNPVQQQDIVALLIHAFTLHQQGQLTQAKAIYEHVLTKDPKNFDALHLLGVIAATNQNPTLAAELLGMATEVNSQNAPAYSNRGAVLNELKRFEEALDSCDRAIVIKPDYADAHYNRGNALSELKRFEEALVSYESAIEIKRDYTDAYNNRAAALQKLKRFEEAVASYDRAISIKPNYADAYLNRGNALTELNRLQEALISFDKAIEIRPDYADAHFNSGNTLSELKRFEEALIRYDKAIAIKPDYVVAYSNRGNTLSELRRFEEALASYERANTIQPSYEDAWYNRGNVLIELNRLEEALSSYDRAIAIKPDYADAYNNRGGALQKLQRFEEALKNFDNAIAVKPDYSFLLGRILSARNHICDWYAHNGSREELKAKLQNREKVLSPFSALAIFDNSQLHKIAAEVWVKDKHPSNDDLGPILNPVRNNKIRLGYYSADFHNHATSYLMADLFESHDRDKFELIAFSFGPDNQDAMRKRVASVFDRFIDVQLKSDKDVALLSREIGIDIAVDLKGFTQNERTGIFSYRCAPIQVNYLGYPGTMGAEYIDYLIADEILIPAENQVHFSEKIVYLPHSYQVNDTKRAISNKIFSRKELGLPEDGFVFCSFNNNFKITPQTFDRWMDLLKAVKGSVLWLLEDNNTAARNLKKEAEKRGVEANRLVFANRMPLSEHLARHRAADLFLDTLPYNAHTTASDALWAGLPVLTQLGESFAGRVAASLLHAINLSELITHTEEEYERKAIDLALNPELMKNIKNKLIKNRLTTPLFNTSLFTRNIQKAYELMYERYHTDLPPDHIYIENFKNNEI